MIMTIIVKYTACTISATVLQTPARKGIQRTSASHFLACARFWGCKRRMRYIARF